MNNRFLKSLALTAALTAIAGAASAADNGVKSISAGAFPISASAKVPAGDETIYVSGLTPSPLAPPAAGAAPAFGDTETQAESVFKKIEEALAAQGATAGDVVSMHVYLVGDPALGGKMDFAGMMKAYTRHFGTTTQPNKPTRTTVQVASLVGPGQLVEIDCIAVKKP
ncbi:MAG TPA: RidA family protein [Caulobacteraceae bacterium]